VYVVTHDDVPIVSIYPRSREALEPTPQKKAADLADPAVRTLSPEVLHQRLEIALAGEERPQRVPHIGGMTTPSAARF
jgi:hypothetical protein